MHEMSLVTGILDIAGREAAAAGARVINTVEVEVGLLAGVEIPSLEFCFEVARKGTPGAENACLVIVEIPGQGTCVECGNKVSVDDFVAVCPDCGQGLVDIEQGRDFRVLSINVD
jgi:hydrogenase nickel incorporation protein HypA/HybF